MGHKESKIFEKVEEAIANQNESNSKSLEKKVQQLWKSLDKKHQDFLGPDEANEFFGKIYDYCKTTLKHEGVVFDPSLSRDDLIASWKKTFDKENTGHISYEQFCLALKAVASACNKELREKEEKELATPTTAPPPKNPASPRGAKPAAPASNLTKSGRVKLTDEVLEEEHKLLEDLAQKDKPKEKKEKKEKKDEEPSIPSTLKKVFAHNENPILMQTFEFKCWSPKHIEHFVTPPWTGQQTEAVLSKLCSFVPLEYPKLGLNVILDGIPGAGLSTIMEKYCGEKEEKNEEHPLAFTECKRDIFNIGLYIPIKIYKYSPRDQPTDPYIKFASGLLAKVDLWIFVFDITQPLNEETLTLISTRIKLVTEFFKQMKLNPAMLFIGSKLDDRDIRDFSWDDGRKLAEKYGAMYTEMSGATGMFVVRGWNTALRAAIGHKEQKSLFNAQTTIV